MLILWLCCVCKRFWLCLYSDCWCLRGCMHVCACVLLYADCVVFVCVSGHVCKVIVCACLGVCVFVNVCACIMVVLCLCASLAKFVW